VCGCGEVVGPGNRFIKGHHKRGVRNTVETNRRNGQKILKLWQDPEYVRKMKQPRPKMSQYWRDPVHVEKHSQKMLKMWKDPEFVKKQTRYRKDPVYVENVRRKILQKWKDPEVVKKHRLAMQLYYSRFYSVEKHSQRALKMWKDPEFVKKQMKARCIKPNKSELALNDLLNKILPGEYKFVGDFQFVVGGKCPDFLNVNGQKKLIELFGGYWHDPEYFPADSSSKDRIDHFKPYGFDTLVIREHELKDIKQLREKILLFNKRGEQCQQR